MSNGNRGSACKAPTTYDLSQSSSRMDERQIEAHGHVHINVKDSHDRALFERFDSGARPELHAHLIKWHLVHVP